jgi:hypothetical protein
MHKNFSKTGIETLQDFIDHCEKNVDYLNSINYLDGIIQTIEVTLWDLTNSQNAKIKVGINGQVSKWDAKEDKWVRLYILPGGFSFFMSLSETLLSKVGISYLDLHGH